MKNKHPQMYSLNESARREILEQFVARYIDHVSPNNVNNGGGASDRNHDVASEILAIGPIQVEGLNLGTGGGGADHSHPSIHEIKVENDPLNHSGPSKADPGRGEPPRPPDNIMVELGEPDSEMLLVK